MIFVVVKAIVFYLCLLCVVMAIAIISGSNNASKFDSIHLGRFDFRNCLPNFDLMGQGTITRQRH